MIFSPSLEAIFRQSPEAFGDQVRKVHSLGFSAFEFWGLQDKNLLEIRQIQEELGIILASFCATADNLVEPSQRARYIETLRVDLDAAKQLGCKYLIGLTGDFKPDNTYAEQLQSIVDGLKECAPLLEEAGVTLVLEPLNTKVDHRGYFLERTGDAIAIVDQVGCPQVKILYDVYHQQISEGDIIHTITKNIDKIGYFHVADTPGRHELGTGEINYHNVLRAIQETGYTGYVGLEYFPLNDPVKSLRQFLNDYAPLGE